MAEEKVIEEVVRYRCSKEKVIKKVNRKSPVERIKKVHEKKLEKKEGEKSKEAGRRRMRINEKRKREEETSVKETARRKKSRSGRRQRRRRMGINQKRKTEGGHGLALHVRVLLAKGFIFYQLCLVGGSVKFGGYLNLII
ncbi:vicilin-like seed storage protein At2g18540 [Eucalyptus grandis]|uniref:vicilin-like seed storage protein At2g18540 n=1 Tax=Eucalyptus grandis TaxID=71139 RepID=UPI00192EC2E4|nr:vicilin-like seed storage protein At2g18540 [Eucalyptus grandis]